MTTNTTLADLFATNKSTEEDGAWVDVTNEIKFKIRAFSSKAVSDLRETLVKPYKSILRAGGEIPAKENEKIGLQVIAGAVLAGWQGVPAEVADGEPPAELPYTAENALNMLTAMPRMANFIVGISTDVQFYKDALVEQGLGN